MESALLHLDGVQDAVVVGRPGRTGGERLVAYLVPKGEGTILRSAEIRNSSRMELPFHGLSGPSRAGRDPREIRRLLNVFGDPAKTTATWVEELLPLALEDGIVIARCLVSPKASVRPVTVMFDDV